MFDINVDYSYDSYRLLMILRAKSNEKNVISMEFAWVMVGIGVWAYLLFGGLTASIKCITDAIVKRAEAKAKAEEHRTERARLELERAKVEHDKSLT